MKNIYIILLLAMSLMIPVQLYAVSLEGQDNNAENEEGVYTGAIKSDTRLGDLKGQSRDLSEVPLGQLKSNATKDMLGEKEKKKTEEKDKYLSHEPEEKGKITVQADAWRLSAHYLLEDDKDQAAAGRTTANAEIHDLFRDRVGEIR